RRPSGARLRCKGGHDGAPQRCIPQDVSSKRRGPRSWIRIGGRTTRQASRFKALLLVVRRQLAVVAELLVAVELIAVTWRLATLAIADQLQQLGSQPLLGVAFRPVAAVAQAEQALGALHLLG